MKTDAAGPGGGWRVSVRRRPSNMDSGRRRSPNFFYGGFFVSGPMVVGGGPPTVFFLRRGLAAAPACGRSGAAPLQVDARRPLGSLSLLIIKRLSRTPPARYSLLTYSEPGTFPSSSASSAPPAPATYKY